MASIAERPFAVVDGAVALGQYDPVRLHRSIAEQSDDELPPSTTQYDYASEGGLMAPAPGRVKRLGIPSSPMRQASLPGKFAVMSETEGLGDLDPNNRAQALSWKQFLQAYATPVVVATSYAAEFLSGSGWTSTNWTGSWAGGWDHTTGNVSVLSHSGAAVVATEYLVTYTVSGRTAGSFTLTFGGESSAAGLTATGTFTPTASTTGGLTATPTTDFDGAIVFSITAVTSKAYRHRYGYSQANRSAAWQSIISDDDAGRPIRFEHGVIPAINLTAKPKSNIRLTVNRQFGAYDMHGAVTESVGTGETVPLVRYFASAMNLAVDASDQAIYMVCSTATSGGVTGFRFKIGSGGTLGTEILMTHGGGVAGGTQGVGQSPHRANWYYVRVGASDVLVGDEGEAIMVHAPYGATYAAVAPDTFLIPKRRDRVATSIGTRYPLPEINSKLYLGLGGSGSATQRFAIHNGYELSGIKATVEVVMDTGGRQAVTVDVRGERAITLKLDRRHLDATFENINLRQQALSAVLTIYSTANIGSTSIPFGYVFVLPYLTIGDQPAWSVADGAANLDESYVWTAEEVPSGTTALTWGGLTFTDDLDVLLYNGLASI